MDVVSVHSTIEGLPGGVAFGGQDWRLTVLNLTRKVGLKKKFMMKQSNLNGSLELMYRRVMVHRIAGFPSMFRAYIDSDGQVKTSYVCSYW